MLVTHILSLNNTFLHDTNTCTFYFVKVDFPVENCECSKVLVPKCTLGGTALNKIRGLLRWVLQLKWSDVANVHATEMLLVYVALCCNCVFLSFPPPWRCEPTRVMASSFLRFLDHTHLRITVGRTPLDELSARRRDLYLTTHNTHNRQTFMPPVGFEPTISAGERPQTYALDRAATGTGIYSF